MKPADDPAVLLAAATVLGFVVMAAPVITLVAFTLAYRKSSQNKGQG